MRAIVPTVVVAIALLVAVPVSGGAEPAARIVDRTLVCTTTGIGAPDPLAFVTLRASSSERESSAWIYNGPNSPKGVSMRVGTGGIALIPSSCVRTNRRVRLTSAGLRRASIGILPRQFTCEATARTLVRLRGVFTRPTRFVRNPRFPWISEARGTVGTGYLAVATLRGRPVVFASVGRTPRFFVAPQRCLES